MPTKPVIVILTHNQDESGEVRTVRHPYDGAPVPSLVERSMSHHRIRAGCDFVDVEINGVRARELRDISKALGFSS